MGEGRDQKSDSLFYSRGITHPYLARVEAIHCSDSAIVVADYHSGQSFSLFHQTTGSYYGRFGTIGQAPAELPQGCFGSVIGRWFYVHDSSSLGYVARYSLDSLRHTIHTPPRVMVRFKSPSKHIFISEVLPVHDSLFLAAGLYIENAQYFMFDRESLIKGYGIDCVKDPDRELGFFQKALGNQGKLRKHPSDSRFVYFVRNSSNLDFFEIKSNTITPIRLQRENGPSLVPVQNGTMLGVSSGENAEIGYMDLCVGEKWVYALHSSKSVTKPYCSNTIRVFDWNGAPVKQIVLDKEAYYIAVDEASGTILAAVRDADQGWEVWSYSIGR